MVLVLDVLAKDGQPVDLGGERGRDRGLGRVGELGDLAGRSRGVAGDHRHQAELADHLAALAERVHVAVHRADRLQRRCPARPSA